MIRDLGQETFEQAHAPLYDTIECDSNTPLYQGVHIFHAVVSSVSFGKLEGKIWVE